MCDSSFDSCGDGIGVFGAGCMASLRRCTVRKSMRCAVRVGSSVARGARAILRECQVTSNGRGIIVAARSKADVRECYLDDHVGWAIRLDENKEADQSNDSVGGDTCSHSVIANNVFGNTTRGTENSTVSKKRIRIDTWHEGRFYEEGNQDANDGTEVQAFRKRFRS
jgi:hypothetical protein